MAKRGKGWRRQPGTLWSLLLCLLLGCTCAAASAPRFQHFGAADGLPQQQVLSLHQDALGYLWIGTYAGLGRYNGREFKIYSTADGLASNTVQSMTSSADGQVWAGTTRGLCRFQREMDRFECPQLANLPMASIQALASTGNSVLVGSASGLYELRPAADSLTLEKPEVRAVVADLNIASLARGDDGSVWIGTQTGLLRWFSVTGQYASVRLPIAAAPEVSALLVEKDRVWIGSSKGLLVLEGENLSPATGVPAAASDMAITGIARSASGVLWITGNRGVLRGVGTALELIDLDAGLSTLVNQAVVIDTEGSVWIGGDGGLSRYRPGAFVSYHSGDGLLGDFARTLRQDARGRLWVGSRQGVQIVERVDGQWRFDLAARITPDNGLPGDSVYDIAFPDEQSALIATSQGLALWREGEGIARVYTERDGLPVNSVRSLRIEPDGRVWIGTMTGVALMQQGHIVKVADPLLVDARVLSIHQDLAGWLWFASLHHGLLRLGTDGSVRRLGSTDGLSDEVIWDADPDSEGGLWIASNGDGLFHLAANGEVRRFTREHGMPDNFVWNVLAEPSGDVWAFTNRGIARLRDGRFETYSEADGIIHPEGVATVAMISREGERWFGSARGLVRYAPENETAPTPQPRAIIEQVRAGGTRIAPESKLDATTTGVEFEFAALTLYRSNDLRYRYRLLGSDENWSQPLSYRPITFASLAHGSYRFEVQARFGTQAWGPSASFGYRIEPVWWQRPISQALLALLGVGLIAFALRMRLRALRANEIRLTREVDQRTQALAEANLRLEQASLTDPLTGLANRRYLARQVLADVAQCRREYRQPLNLGQQRDMVFLMVDIDHFKQINDRYGHAGGDAVLRQFADSLTALIRESDYAVRWGGEEFLIIARHADARLAGAMAERIVSHIRDQLFTLPHGPQVRCTCSIGVTSFPLLTTDADAAEWEQVVDLADAAAFLAKRRGRDGWVEVSAAAGLRSADVPDLLAAAREDIEAGASRGLLELRGSQRPLTT